MSFIAYLDLAAFAGIAFAAALMALAGMSFFDARRPPGPGSIHLLSDDQTVFLFDGRDLIDATTSARQLLSAAPQGESDWTRLLTLLTPRFAGLDSSLDSLADVGLVRRVEDKGEAQLRAEMRGDLVRLTLIDPDVSGERADIDVQSLDAIERELESLRAVADRTPFLMWRRTADGRITWVNRTYLETAERVRGKEAVETWPPPDLLELTPHAEGREMFRAALCSGPAGREEWYDCHAARLGADTLFTAVNADATVQAEKQLREFTQTLTKTFAHLTIGLAVFDRARRLALFNPALTDLTGLPIDFLTARPTLFGFLDRLRERRMIPEPKDYKSWRRRIIELEAAAADGSYAETWSLPHGQTYRVTGRPHPDGAVAFLFEDISAEISLTRRFRAELEIGQSALDSFEEAVAVFSSGGILVMANNAYGELWGEDPDTTLSDIGVVEATRRWMALTAPTPIWGDFRDFIAQSQERSEWGADARLRDGRSLACRFVPIAGGATLARFRIGERQPQPAQVVHERA